MSEIILRQIQPANHRRGLECGGNRNRERRARGLNIRRLLRRHQQTRRSQGQRSLSQQIGRRVLILSTIAVLGLVTAMSLGLTASVERVKRQLDRASAEAARSFDLFLLRLESDLLATSTALAVADDPEEVLRSMLARNRAYRDILLVDAESQVIAQRNRVGRLRANRLTVDALPDDPLPVNEVRWSEVQFEQQSPYLDLAIAVTDDIGLAEATLLARVDLAALWETTIEIRAGDSGYAYVTDDSGQLVAVRNRRLQARGTTLQTLIGRSPLQVARSGFNLYRGIRRQWVMGSAQRLEVLPWFAVVEQPAREFILPLALATLLWLGVLAAVAVLVLNAIRFTRQRIVAPLAALGAAVTHFSDSDWEYRFQIDSQDELGQLAHSVQQMAAQLQASFAAIERDRAKMQILNESLSQSESKLTQFLEALPVGIFVVNAEGKPYYANQRAQALLGRGIVFTATAATLGRAYRAYVAGSSRPYPSDQQPIVRALHGETSTVDNLEIHQRDRVVPLEVWGTPVYNAEGEIVYAIAAMQDITARKRVEAERNEITEQLKLLNLAYERFVPSEFLQLLAKESIVDVQIGEAVEREMSVLFADIRDFTALSEKMTPEDNFRFINAYLSRMEPAIADNNGFIDKYVGDEIMALFSGKADDAVSAGVAMLRRLTRYNTTRQRPDRAPIRIGIGINTGRLMLGTVGGSQRMDSTVISDTVNLAARLEALTKAYEVSLLISHETFLRLDRARCYGIRLIDRVSVSGKSELISVFEVFEADRPDLYEGKRATKTKFEQAMMLYYLGSLAAAADLFEQCLRACPGDRVAQIYLDRCHKRQ